MNHLYYGDNLSVLRESIRDDSVDLIYLDPPFNSNASYNVLFKGPSGSESAAQIERSTIPGAGTTRRSRPLARCCARAMARRPRCCARCAGSWARTT